MKLILPFIVIIIALVVLGPFFTIWSLNTLFPVLAIPYTLDTWVAVIILGGVFKTSVSFKK